MCPRRSRRTLPWCRNTRPRHPHHRRQRNSNSSNLSNSNLSLNLNSNNSSWFWPTRGRWVSCSVLFFLCFFTLSTSVFPSLYLSLSSARKPCVHTFTSTEHTLAKIHAIAHTPKKLTHIPFPLSLSLCLSPRPSQSVLITSVSLFSPFCLQCKCLLSTVVYSSCCFSLPLSCFWFRLFFNKMNMVVHLSLKLRFYAMLCALYITVRWIDWMRVWKAVMLFIQTCCMRI